MTGPAAFDGIRVRAAQIGMFETPILHGRLADAEELTRSLAASIRRRQAEQPSLARSNVGGWHSATDMLDWGGEPAARLADTAVRMAKRLSWFEVATRTRSTGP